MKIVWIALLLVGVFGAYFFREQQHNKIFAEALSHYQQGQTTKETFIRNREFNQALALFLTLPPSTEKHTAMGALLVQLRETPLAIYYFRQALKDDSSNRQALDQLKAAQQQEGISADIPKTRINWRFILTPLVLLTTVLAFFWIIFKQSFWKWCALIALLPCLYIGGIIFKEFYLGPIEGVIVHSTHLYQGASLEYLPVSHVPIPGGTKVEVLDLNDEGKWLKVRIDNSIMGYIPEESIRIIK